MLNRFNGFAAVDNASFAQTGVLNFFGTILATGTAYTAGASAADVAGPSGRFTPGFVPIGADGRVDGYDIDYIYRQFKRNPRVADGALNWSNLSEAVRAVNVAGEVCGDLSCDVNGDLVINQADGTFVLVNILNTSMGDVNLDGVVNAADRAIIAAHIGQNGGWAAGDINGDGVVNAADLAAFDTRLRCSPADIATEGNPDPLSGPDGFITGIDFDVYIEAFYKEYRRPSDNALIADLTDGLGTGGPDTFLTGTDFDFFILAYFQGC